MNHLQQLESSLGKRIELICTSNIYIYIYYITEIQTNFVENMFQYINNYLNIIIVYNNDEILSL